MPAVKSRFIDSRLKMRDSVKDTVHLALQLSCTKNKPSVLFFPGKVLVAGKIQGWLS